VEDFDAAIAHLKEHDVKFRLEPLATPVCRMAMIFVIRTVTAFAFTNGILAADLKSNQEIEPRTEKILVTRAQEPAPPRSRN